MTTHIERGPAPRSEINSAYAWMRLGIALVLGTVGSVGMWSFVVALPAVQADFGVARGEASLPLHADDDRLRRRRHRDGPAGRPLRHRACRSIDRRDRARRSATAVGHSPPTSGSSRWRRA